MPSTAPASTITRAPRTADGSPFIPCSPLSCARGIGHSWTGRLHPFYAVGRATLQSRRAPNYRPMSFLHERAAAGASDEILLDGLWRHVWGHLPDATAGIARARAPRAGT